MQAYRVDVFDRNFNNFYHATIDKPLYTEDYIELKRNTVTCRTDENVKRGNIVTVTDGTRTFFGFVESTTIGESNMTITYLPYLSVFNTQVLFDTDWQGSGRSLESVIKELIEGLFVNNSDSLQNVPTIGDVNLYSSTTSWGFNLKSDKEGMHRCIVGLYDTIIRRAFNQYGIVVDCVPNFSSGKVDVNIGVRPERTYTIEADLQEVINASVKVGKVSGVVNKLLVYNDSDYSETLTYYLHTDGTYSTTDTDRVEPVSEKMQSVSVSDGRTFAQVADSAAADVFSGQGFDNNISLELLPRWFDKIRIGQMVNVIHDGVVYQSILSKRELGDTCKLTFGCVRSTLTSLLQGGRL